MKVSGTLRVPGDKSISHRSLILGALAEGESRVTDILQSADVHSTAGVLRALGAEIPDLSCDFTVTGVGLRGLRAPDTDLDCGNSGTTTRLMAGVVSALPISARFIGDASLSRRPMRRVAKPLEAMGATFELPSHGGLPMTVRGGELHDIEWKSAVASAQVKSAMLLAGVVAAKRVTYEEPIRTRDHTERMLRGRGVHVRSSGTRVELTPGDSLKAMDTEVPGDPSSAAFFVALAAMADGGSLRLENVCVNDTRTGFLTVVQRMGAIVRYDSGDSEAGEVVSAIDIEPGTLHAVEVGGEQVPSMIDELPMLACLAARAEGETRITGANELRVKESDRITAVVSNLQAIGVEAHELPDGMTIRGSDKPLGGKVITHGDHRLAMAFGILGAASGNAVEIDDPDCVTVSYPNFWDDLKRVQSE